MIVGESKINDTVNYNLIINSLRTLYYDENKVIFPSDNVIYSSICIGFSTKKINSYIDTASWCTVVKVQVPGVLGYRDI